MSLALQLLAVAVATGLIYVWNQKRAGDALRRRLPPGPKGLPILGNALQLPSEVPWEVFHNWGKDKYGDIFFCSAPGQNLLVLNSFEHAFNLLDKRSSIYSDRRFTPMMELCGFHWLFSNMSYGEDWRIRRKLFHSQFHSNYIHHYNVIIERLSKGLMRSLLATPENYFWHIRRAAGSIIIEVLYGHQVKDDKDLFIRLGERFVKCFESIILPGAHYVDAVPLLKWVPSWFPGGKFQKHAKFVESSLQEAKNRTFEEAKERYDNGTSPDCYVSTLLSELSSENKVGETYETMVRDTAGVAYGAGVDTSAAGVKSFVLMMLKYPEQYAKAQAEIDRVIGSDRLPEIDDRSSLPFTEALMKEVFRWMPGIPIALPHMLNEDDEYMGYHIPKKTTVLANIYSMMRDPRVYKNPERFDPSRFLGDKPERDPRFGGVFGFGRRVCPGRPIAEASVFLNITRITALFDIKPAKDKDGNEIFVDSVEAVRVKTFVGTPKEFPCSITPRSEKTAALLA